MIFNSIFKLKSKNTQICLKLYKSIDLFYNEWEICAKMSYKNDFLFLKNSDFYTIFKYINSRKASNKEKYVSKTI